MDDFTAAIKIESLTRRLEESQAETKKAYAERDQERAGKMIAVAAAAAGMRHSAILDAVHRATLNTIWREDGKGRLVRHGADGLPDIGADGEPITARNVIESYRTEVEHYWPDGVYQPAPAAPAPKPKASSTPGRSVSDSYEDNPWKNFNLTKQAEIYERDPDLAQRLADAAGVPLFYKARKSR